MCFQGFVHFLCGHNKSYEDCCDYANELEVPFWLKVACPNYSTQSQHAKCYCSPNKYYCAKTEDGQLLDQFHSRREKSEQARQHEHTMLYDNWKPAIRKKQQEWEAQGKTLESFQQRPDILKARDSVMDLDRQIREYKADIQYCDNIISAARQYYIHHAQHATVRVPPPSMNLAARLQRLQAQRQMQAQLQTQQQIQAQIQAQQQIEAQRQMQMQEKIQAQMKQLLEARGPMFAQSLLAGLPPHLQARQPQSVGENIVVTPRKVKTRRDLPSNFDVSSHAVQNALSEEQLAFKQKRAQAAIPEAPVTQKKRGRPKKEIKKESSPEKESSSVRRSARTRGKKVNYNEEASEVSQASSPEKSEASAFSPSKSDRSGSPIKGRSTAQQILHENLLGRGNASLADKIAQWKRGGSSIASTSGDGTPRRDSVHAQNGLPAGSPEKDAASEASTTLNTPNKDWLLNSGTYGPETSTAFSAPAYTYAGDISQGWNATPNVAASNPLAYPLMQAPSFSYDQMRRSFHATTDLSHEKAPRAYQGPSTIPYSEPKKRVVSASSPMPDTKRTRLSLPGQGDDDVFR